MLSNHLILYRPLLLLLSIFPSIRVFSNESALHIRWPKYWSFSFNISPYNEHTELIPLGWTGRTFLQSKRLSKVSKTKMQKHQFFGTSFLYSPTLTSIHDYWKNHSLDEMDFVGKVMSLLFKMLSRLVMTFLPRRKRLFISWLQSPSAVILEHPKIKSATVSTVYPSICHEVMGPDAMIFVF